MRVKRFQSDTSVQSRLFTASTWNGFGISAVSSCIRTEAVYVSPWRTWPLSITCHDVTCLMTASASFSVPKPSCRPPVDTRYSRVSGWNDRRIVCDTDTGCSSNQYQRARPSSKSVVK